MGVHRLSGLLRAADGDVLAGRCSYPGSHAQARDDAERGIFVKNYIDQSQEFALCAVALAYPVITLLRDEENLAGAAADCRSALSFIVNMVFVIVSRTALVTMPIMLAIFALMHLKWRTNVIIFCAAIAAWRAGLGGIAAVARDDGDVHARLPALQGTQPADVDRAAAGILEEIAAVFCRGADRRTRTGSTRGLFEAAATGPEVLAPAAR